MSEPVEKHDKKVILVVEDDPADQELVRRAHSRKDRRTELHFANGGEEAIDFLRRGAATQEVPRPDLVLLDLNMPKQGGFEVLGVIRSNPALAALPVVVMSTSDQESDVDASYRSGANSFVTKPTDLRGMIRVMDKIETFWFEVAVRGTP